MEVGGLEFMDYQNGDLFRDLVNYFDTDLVNQDDKWYFKDRERAAEALQVIFMKHTEFCLICKQQIVFLTRQWMQVGLVPVTQSISKVLMNTLAPAKQTSAWPLKH